MNKENASIEDREFIQGVLEAGAGEVFNVLLNNYTYTETPVALGFSKCVDESEVNKKVESFTKTFQDNRYVLNGVRYKYFPNGIAGKCASKSLNEALRLMYLDFALSNLKGNSQFAVFYDDTGEGDINVGMFEDYKRMLLIRDFVFYPTLLKDFVAGNMGLSYIVVNSHYVSFNIDNCRLTSFFSGKEFTISSNSVEMFREKCDKSDSKRINFVQAVLETSKFIKLFGDSNVSFSNESFYFTLETPGPTKKSGLRHLTFNYSAYFSFYTKGKGKRSLSFRFSSPSLSVNIDKVHDFLQKESPL